MDRQEIKEAYEALLDAEKLASDMKVVLYAQVSAYMTDHLEHQVGDVLVDPSSFRRGSYRISELRPVLNGSSYEIFGDLLTKKGTVNKAHNRTYLRTVCYK